MEHIINQSAPRRAWEDTEHFRQISALWFWGVEVICGGALFGIIGGLLGDYWTPKDATPFWQSAYPTIGGGTGVVIGFVIVFILIYLWNLFRAPYKQRDEARNALIAIPGKTPYSLKMPSPPQLNINYEKHKFYFDSGIPIVIVFAEYRPQGLGDMQIESIQLELQGQRIPCIDWQIITISQDKWIHSDNKFRLPDDISIGKHESKLATFANGEWWGSHSFTIEVPEVNPEKECCQSV